MQNFGDSRLSLNLCRSKALFRRHHLNGHWCGHALWYVTVQVLDEPSRCFFRDTNQSLHCLTQCWTDCSEPLARHRHIRLARTRLQYICGVYGRILAEDLLDDCVRSACTVSSNTAGISPYTLKFRNETQEFHRDNEPCLDAIMVSL